MVRYIADPEEDLETIHEPVPRAYLTLIVEGRISHSFPLRGKMQLGRDKSNAIVVADPKVSRHHASLVPIDKAFIISDLGSANGTYVNGVRIAQPTRLKDNDRVSIGDATFLFTASQLNSNAVDRPLSPPPASSPPRPLVPGFAPAVSIVTENSVPLWVLIGCMVLVIIGLLFVVAVLLGLFVGSSQVLGIVSVGLIQMAH